MVVEEGVTYFYKLMFTFQVCFTRYETTHSNILENILAVYTYLYFIIKYKSNVLVILQIQLNRTQLIKQQQSGKLGTCQQDFCFSAWNPVCTYI